MTDPHKPIETVFNAAKALAPNDQKAFLDLACKGDAALRQEVERLLAAASAADGFFETKPVGPDDPGITLVDTTVREGPGTAIDRYKLLQQIGEGGMGVVYMAEQTEPVVRKVALKIIKLGMDTKAVVARFEAERQALALMDHPNIAKVLDAGATDTGRPYFVMELVRGIPITEYCDKNHLSARQRLELFIPVCQAIQHAHQKGIIHRDIKPSNVLVTLHDDHPFPMVIDFGIAKATNQRLTEKTLFTNFAQVIGTPAYMSPEQAAISKLDVDTRTDIYSLGVLLYELLTGTTPFTAKELMQAGYGGMQRIIAEQEPPRPSTRLNTMQQNQRTTVARNRRMELPALTRLFQGDLDWVVMKCLEKERTRRYETASALAADLQRHIESEPVVARPPTAGYRLRKAIRRNKLAYSAAAAIVLTLAAAAVVSTVLWLRESQAHDRASASERAAQAARAEEARLRVRAEETLYAARMNLVRHAWEENNARRMRGLLKETADSPLRGWEWNYWQRQLHRPSMLLRGHLGELMCVLWSRDGRYIVTGSFDRTAKVWDATTGRTIRTLAGHTDCVSALAMSPDGRRVATGSWDKKVNIWDFESGALLLTLEGHTAGVNSVAFSPDGTRIVSGAGMPDDNSDPIVRIWDASKGEVALQLTGHTAGIFCVGFTPDGQHVVSGSQDRTARVWNASDGRYLLSFNGHSREVASLAFSPDGRRVVTGSNDGTVKIWDPETGREISSLPARPTWINSVAYSPDGRTIVTANEDSTLTVWDVATGTERSTLKGHGGRAQSLAFSPDSRRIVSVAGDWMDASRIDRAAMVWDLPRSEGPRILGVSRGEPVYKVSVSPDGMRLATGGKSVKIWDTSTGEKTQLSGGITNASGLAVFSPAGRLLVTGSQDDAARVWDLIAGRELVSLVGHGRKTVCASFSPDGGRIVTGSRDQTLKVWEVPTGRELCTMIGHQGYIFSVAFSPDGRRIVSACSDGTAIVWEATTGRRLNTFTNHGMVVTCASFSPDGRRLVSGSSDQTARVWDAVNGRELLVLRGHRDQVWAAAFTPDGRRIITGSVDQTARVWDAENGNELLVLNGHQDRLHGVACFPDGRRIATSSWDGTIRVWEAATEQQIAAWAREEDADREPRDTSVVPPR